MLKPLSSSIWVVLGLKEMCTLILEISSKLKQGSSWNSFPIVTCFFSILYWRTSEIAHYSKAGKYLENILILCFANPIGYFIKFTLQLFAFFNMELCNSVFNTVMQSKLRLNYDFFTNFKYGSISLIFQKDNYLFLVSHLRLSQQMDATDPEGWL